MLSTTIVRFDLCVKEKDSEGNLCRVLGIEIQTPDTKELPLRAGYY